MSEQEETAKSKNSNRKERGSTRREILRAAMDLFSVKGYEATSVADIAERVGIRKASLYSHFENKQDILDSLLAETTADYERHSLFTKTAPTRVTGSEGDAAITPQRLISEVTGHIRYILHDPVISRMRKFLTVEQFRTPQLAELQTKRTYTDVMRYFTELMRDLIRQGVLIHEDAETLAAEFCLPISVWINLCDREPEREREVLSLVERHVRAFFTAYSAAYSTNNRLRMEAET